MNKLLATVLTVVMFSSALCAAGKHVVSIKVVDGMVFVPVKVNGSDILLMLDTGATNIVVNPKAVHVPVNASRTALLGEGHQQVNAAVARLDVKLGDIRIDSALVVLTDLTGTRKWQVVSGQKFDGLLGQDILSQFKSVRIDYRNKVMELEN